jgi:hypothetical protein
VAVARKGKERGREGLRNGGGLLRPAGTKQVICPWLHEPARPSPRHYSVFSPCPSLIFPPCPSILFHPNHLPLPLLPMPAVFSARITPLSPTSTARSKPPKLNWLRLWQTPAAPSNSSNANAQLWRTRFPALSHTCHLSGGFPLNSCGSFS